MGKAATHVASGGSLVETDTGRQPHSLQLSSEEAGSLMGCTASRVAGLGRAWYQGQGQ